MMSRKKENRFSQKQKQADEAVSPQAGLSFFNKFPRRISAKIGGAAVFALIVLHFVSQFVFFQNENAQYEIAPPKIENEQIAAVKQDYKPVESDVVTTPEPVAQPDITQPAIAQSPVVHPERKTSILPKTVRKKQLRVPKAERPRRSYRTERVFREDEVASVFPYGRFLTRSASR